MRRPARFDAHGGEPPVVVLTGASSGIGRAAALAFADRQALLVLAARPSEALEEVAAGCRAAGAQAIAVPTDVTDCDAVQALADAAIERFGRIDVWINNVGVGAVGRFEEVPMPAHRRTIETNLLGHMHGAHAALPHFRRQRRGVLINMASLGGWVPAPYAAAYGASKFGVRGFSEALRAEVSDLPQVHVCTVYPSFVDTPGLSHGANYTGRHLAAPPPLVDPRSVARTLVRLAWRPRATVAVGSAAWPARIGHALAPGLTGRLARWAFDLALAQAKPARASSGNLFGSAGDHAIDGGQRQARRPAAVAAGVGALLLGVAVGGWLLRPRSLRGGRRSQ